MTDANPLRGRWAAFLVAAVGTAACMVWSWITSPPVTPVDGTPRYGGNHEGGLTWGLVGLAIEVVIVVSVLRPWNYDHSWTRPLSLVLPAAGIALLLFATIIHSSPIHVILMVWTFFVFGWLSWMAAIDGYRARAQERGD